MGSWNKTIIIYQYFLVLDAHLWHAPHVAKQQTNVKYNVYVIGLEIG